MKKSILHILHKPIENMSCESRECRKFNIFLLLTHQWQFSLKALYYKVEYLVNYLRKFS